MFQETLKKISEHILEKAIDWALDHWGKPVIGFGVVGLYILLRWLFNTPIWTWFVWPILIFSLTVLSLDKLFKILAQNRNKSIRTINEIHFNYLPDSPLKNGWKLAYCDPGVTVRWLQSAELIDGMDMITDGKYAIERVLDPSTSLSDRLEYSAKYSDSTMIFVKVGLVSPKGKHEDKWIKFKLGNNPPIPTEDNANEWTMFISGTPRDNQWREFNIPLRYAVEQTWGTKGWNYSSLKMIRLRGNMGISPIKCIQSA